MAGFKPGADWRPYGPPDGSRKFLVDPTGFEAAEFKAIEGWAPANPVYVMREYDPLPEDKAPWKPNRESSK